MDLIFHAPHSTYIRKGEALFWPQGGEVLWHNCKHIHSARGNETFVISMHHLAKPHWSNVALNYSVFRKQENSFKSIRVIYYYMYMHAIFAIGLPHPGAKMDFALKYSQLWGLPSTIMTITQNVHMNSVPLRITLFQKWEGILKIDATQSHMHFIRSAW